MAIQNLNAYRFNLNKTNTANKKENLNQANSAQFVQKKDQVSFGNNAKRIENLLTGAWNHVTVSGEHGDKFIKKIVNNRITKTLETGNYNEIDDLITARGNISKNIEKLKKENSNKLLNYVDYNMEADFDSVGSKSSGPRIAVEHIIESIDDGIGKVLVENKDKKFKNGKSLVEGVTDRLIENQAYGPVVRVLDHGAGKLRDTEKIPHKIGLLDFIKKPKETFNKWSENKFNSTIPGEQYGLSCEGKNIEKPILDKLMKKTSIEQINNNKIDYYATIPREVLKRNGHNPSGLGTYNKF